jgi:predicted pyridoxine 5'-phosphate oxidase superfamily flavin-nucleotide-binding protein
VIALTEEMREAIATAAAKGRPVLVATAAADGTPNVAFKGSTMVWDGEHLAYWERSFGQTLANIEATGRVCLLYRDPETRLAWKFLGTGQVLREGEMHEALLAAMALRGLKPEASHAGVLIRVDRVFEAGKVIMERED